MLLILHFDPVRRPAGAMRPMRFKSWDRTARKPKKATGGGLVKQWLDIPSRSPYPAQSSAIEADRTSDFRRAAGSIRERFVVVLDIPEVNGCDNDQKGRQHSHLVPPSVSGCQRLGLPLDRPGQDNRLSNKRRTSRGRSPALRL